MYTTCIEKYTSDSSLLYISRYEMTVICKDFAYGVENLAIIFI